MEVRLRPQGVGRYFGAAFLAFWLCGWAAGEVFARCGAKVSLCSRKADRVAAAVETIKGHGAEAWGGAADVRDYAQMEAVLKSAKEHLGPIDVIVSGAAGNFVAPALGMGVSARGVPVNVTLLDGASERIYGTQGDGRCQFDEVEQKLLADDGHSLV